VFYYAVRCLARFIIKLLYRVEVAGRENVPEEGPALLCSNHKSWLDMFLAGINIKRQVYYMAKSELFANFLFSAVFKGLGAYPVKRGTGDIKAIKTTLDLLEKGCMVGIFPEGRRIKEGSKEKVAAKPGTALIAVKSGAPVVPVAIRGSYKPFGTIKVVFGEPFKIDTEQNKKYTTKEMAQLSQEIINRIYSLMEEA